MSIADTEPRTTGRVYTCMIAELIAADERPADAAARVAEKFADETLSLRALAEWLGVSEKTVTKHRGTKNVAPYCACVR